MNTLCLDLMEKSLSAYSDERIFSYFNDVKKNGLTEHGFPRLTVNIGGLLAYHRRCDLMPIFLEMMEFCCKTIPNVKAANDFSVREIICCIYELEKAKAVDKELIARWKRYLASIEPQSCYSVYARTEKDRPKNWALFTGVSEFFRQRMGLCDSAAFIDIQIASQLQEFDRNGMYKDHAEVQNPIVYDLVPRGLFCILLFAGYDGKYCKEIDNILKKSAMHTLDMQSVSGEIPFGGRSNQFLHNEALLALIFEYEAKRYKNEGDDALARLFKSKARRALNSIRGWLKKDPVSHIKNRFPVDSGFGCEGYAYFDKYMITTASFVYAAGLIADDSIPVEECGDEPVVWETSESFHKIFVRSAEYALEFETNADFCYDANGLGRIHKKGAPSAICLSLPFPPVEKCVLGGIANKTDFSIAPTIKDQGEWIFGSTKGVSYRLVSQKIENDSVFVRLDCSFANGKKVQWDCLVTSEGVSLSVNGEADQEIGLLLSAFVSDGEKKTKITERSESIEVEYDGWICSYQSNRIVNLDVDLANRNGLYRGYMAVGKESLSVNISIRKK